MECTYHGKTRLHGSLPDLAHSRTSVLMGARENHYPEYAVTPPCYLKEIHSRSCRMTDNLDLLHSN